jgi:hypothetical protein
MASYTDASAASGPAVWLVDLTDELHTSDFVHGALRRAVLGEVMNRAPASSADDAGASHVTADITLTSHSVAAPAPATDDGLHMECREFTLQIAGHLICTWTVCDEVVVSDAAGSGPVGVRLSVRAPEPPSAGAAADSPSWIDTLIRGVVSADFVQSALVGALADALVRATPDQSTDAPGTSGVGAAISLTTQPFQRSGGATDATTTSCHENFFTVGGVQLYHWTVCTEVTDFGSTSPPAPVHLEARHPKHAH